MARRRFSKKVRRHRAPFTLPLAVLGGFVPTAAAAVETAKAQGPMGGAKMLALKLTGFNAWTGKWYANELAAGWVPILAGMFAHKMANRMGINRMIARAGIPVFRI